MNPSPSPVLPIVSLVAAAGALGVALLREPPPAPVPPTDAAMVQRIRVLEEDADRQRRKATQLEADLQDTRDRLQELRAHLAREGDVKLPPMAVRLGDGGLPPSTGNTAPADAQLAFMEPDGGVNPLLAAAVRQVVEADRARFMERMAARREAADADWLGTLQEKLGLQEGQLQKFSELRADIQARRAALAENSANMDRDARRAARAALDKEYNDGVRGILTTEQQEKYDAMDRREREPPRGGPPPPPEANRPAR